MNKIETFIEPKLKGVSFRWQRSTGVRNKRIVTLSDKVIEHLQTKHPLVVMDSIGLFLTFLRKLNKPYNVIHLVDYASREKVDDFIVENGIRDKVYVMINYMDEKSYKVYVSIKDEIASFSENQLLELKSLSSFIDYIEKEYKNVCI